MKFRQSHLAYCTNIHPAESWEETMSVLGSSVLAVRDELRASGDAGVDDPFAIGLRLSARAATEGLLGGRLAKLRDWLAATNTYIFTINGFPYGDFHGTRVKEKVFQPDWTSEARVSYTRDLFRILAAVARPGTGASVSTLPGSHKSFGADERLIRRNLIDLAAWLDDLAAEHGHDFHLGLEPEPLGHFENTAETLAFFDRLLDDAGDPDPVRRRIGLNFDTCHFALEYDDIGRSLEAIHQHGIRLSKIHLSSALAFDPRDPATIPAIRPFDEPTYFHQVITRDEAGSLTRFIDLPEFLRQAPPEDAVEARVHFHIPLDADPTPPLRSTRSQAREALDWTRQHPEACPHFEIETYTWAVLPVDLQRPVTSQIADEYRWVLANS